MTKSENLARDKHIIDVVSGAVYRENGECVNVKCSGNRTKWPHWDFVAFNYELFTPDFSWELFKEGLLMIECETNNERIVFLHMAINRGASDKIKPYMDTPAYIYYNNNGTLISDICQGRRGCVVIPFSSIPPELLEPAFEPRKPETFTCEEWAALTPKERKACNELIRGEIEWGKDDKAINLEWYDPTTGYLPTTRFTAIESCQYRIKPKPEYEPYDKPEAWMVGETVLFKNDAAASLITGVTTEAAIVDGMYYELREMFDMVDLYDRKTGETRPFGKLKGGE